jgi:hypothetical protein
MALTDALRRARRAVDALLPVAERVEGGEQPWPGWEERAGEIAAVAAQWAAWAQQAAALAPVPKCAMCRAPFTPTAHGGGGSVSLADMFEGGVIDLSSLPDDITIDDLDPGHGAAGGSDTATPMRLGCCRGVVCRTCLSRHVQAAVDGKRIKADGIRCPLPTCSRNLAERDARVSGERVGVPLAACAACRVCRLPRVPLAVRATPPPSPPPRAWWSRA